MKIHFQNLHCNQTIKSLSIFLTETQSQYNQCFGEASAQDSLLELQREAIYSLQTKIQIIECGVFLNTFVLHLIYYIILFKYKDELKIQTQNFIALKNKVDTLEYENRRYQNQCINLELESREAKEEVDKLRYELEELRTKAFSEKQRQIDILISEKIDLKKQLCTYKLDFELIEIEMKKMGVINSSIERFKAELSSMRSENVQYRLDIESYLKSLEDLTRNNDTLKNKLSELKLNRDNQIEKYKERILQLRNEISIQQDKIRRLNTKFSCGETLISKQVQVIENLRGRLFYNDRHTENCCSDFHFSKETIYDLRAHIDSLKVSLADKFDYITKLKNDNQLLKNENNILEAESDCLKYELDQTKLQLHESKEKHKKISEDLNKYIHKCQKRFAAVQQNLANSLSPRQGNMTNIDVEKKLVSLDEKLNLKTAALVDIQSKFSALTSKYESSERSCQRQKDEIMLLEKKLQVLQQKFQNCTEKNEDLLRQNKSLEDHNNKCMTELEDIMLQLGDMQLSLVDLRTECDTKAQSLDAVSVELEKMKASKSEVCKETKYVLQWVRVWMRQQKQITTILQNKLHEKQQQLLHISIDKKNFTTAMRRLRRANKILTKRLKLIHKPTCKQVDTVFHTHSSNLQKMTKWNSIKQNSHRKNSIFSHLAQRQSREICSSFKRKRLEERYRTMNKLITQGDSVWFPAFEYLMKEIPQSSQLNEHVITSKSVHNAIADGGYQTSSRKIASRFHGSQTQHFYELTFVIIFLQIHIA